MSGQREREQQPKHVRLCSGKGSQSRSNVHENDQLQYKRSMGVGKEQIGAKFYSKA